MILFDPLFSLTRSSIFIARFCFLGWPGAGASGGGGRYYRGMNSDKRAIRDEMRARRRGLSPAVQRQHGQMLALRVARQSWFIASERVALYLPSDGEIDTRPLIKLCWREGKQAYLPRLRAGGVMEFARYQATDILVRGPYELLQPSPAAATARVESLDAVLTPLVAFTRDGERLGMGGGFYDRALADTPGSSPWIAGLAHSCQQVDVLPREPWDRKVAVVMTETGAVWPPSGKRYISRTRLLRR